MRLRARVAAVACVVAVPGMVATVGPVSAGTVTSGVAAAAPDATMTVLGLVRTGQPSPDLKDWPEDYMCNRPVPQQPPLTGPRSDYTATRALQVALWQGAFRPGPIDGRYGPETKTAVRRFQSGQNVTVDGLVGPQTWRAVKPWHCHHWG